MRTYPKLQHAQDDETFGTDHDHFLVLEKYDGANFRFTINADGSISVGTRNVEYDDLSNIDGSFDHAVEYLESTLENRESVSSEYTMFGEAMHPHHLNYNWDETPNVILYDVYDEGKGEWLHQGKVDYIAQKLNLQTARIVDQTQLQADSLDEGLIPDESEFGDFEPEGVVVKSVDGCERVKVVRDDFKEKLPSASKTNDTGQDDSAAFVKTFVTEARVRKHAYKLRDEGEYDELSMRMMEELPHRVIADILEEESDMVMEWDWTIDFTEVRSKAGPKVANVLRNLQDEE